MRRAHALLLVPLLAAALPAAAAAPAAAPLRALQCGRVFDAEAGRMRGPQTIVVADGLVRELVDGHVAPDGAEVVDLRDRSCSPGWIDLHVHLDGESNPDAYSEGFRMNPELVALRSTVYARRTLEAGFTTVRDLGGETVLALRDAIARGWVVGPRIHAAGNAIGTTGGHADPNNGLNRFFAHAVGEPGPGQGVINGPDGARQAVRARYQEGSDLIKITATGGVLSYARSADAPQFAQDELAAIVATARDYGFRVAAHAHGREGLHRAILAGVDSIEHGTYLDDELFALMRRHGTVYVPTISAGRFVAAKAAEDGFYPDVVRPKAARIGALIQDTFSRAQRAGVTIGFGTDAGVGLHGDNAEEFVFMVEAGMDPAKALQAATVTAARLLGDPKLGRLAPGQHADIVAMPGDPVADIRVVRDVDFVMKGGEIVRRPGDRPAAR